MFMVSIRISWPVFPIDLSSVCATLRKITNNCVFLGFVIVPSMCSQFRFLLSVACDMCVGVLTYQMNIFRSMWDGINHTIVTERHAFCHVSLSNFRVNERTIMARIAVAWKCMVCTAYENEIIFAANVEKFSTKFMWARVWELLGFILVYLPKSNSMFVNRCTAAAAVEIEKKRIPWSL